MGQGQYVIDDQGRLRLTQFDNGYATAGGGVTYGNHHISGQNQNSLVNNHQIDPKDAIELSSDSVEDDQQPVIQHKATAKVKKGPFLKSSQNNLIRAAGVDHRDREFPPIKKITQNVSRSRITDVLEKSLMSKWYRIFMAVVTLYALFGDDIRLTFMNKNADDAIFALSCFALSFFLLEVILSSISIPKYFNSFYFWLDIVATFSLIFDIGWIWDYIVGTEDFSSGNSQQISLIARAGRGARVGTRAGRIVRIVSLFRLIRIVKLFNIRGKSFNDQKQEQSNIYEQRVTTVGQNIPRHIKNLKRGQTLRNDQATINNNEISKDSDLSQTNQVVVRDQNQRRATDVHEKIKQQLNLGVSSHLVTQTENQQNSIVQEGTSQNQLSEQKKQKSTKHFDSKLSELTTRRVIMLVLGIMFSVPVFTNSSYRDESIQYEFSLEILASYNDEPYSEQFNYTFDKFIQENQKVRTPLIFAIALNLTWISDKSPDELRALEKQVIEKMDGNYIAVYDLSKNTRLSAGLGILRTCFVCFLLAIGAIFFQKDAQSLVIDPIDSMIKKVNRIASNPLDAAQEEEKEALEKEKQQQNGQDQNKSTIISKFMKLFQRNKDEQQETVILEQTIIKIGALLALGFGEAGVKIIADNMANNGDVDPMIPGNKVVGIFGFCDIRQFTDTTEILQEEVMVFVNEIAEIVHGLVDKFSGAANKNIGDAFLLVWKFPESEVEYDLDINTLVAKKSLAVSQIADMTVISFLKIIAQIKKSFHLDKYRSRQDILEKLPNYSVKMGFGLHVGWSIEGAIGSEFKIDASYLSPNVNMASRLEAATKQFGVNILISGALKNICTETCQAQLRHIDTVVVKGASKPIELYTCDTDTTELKIEKKDRNKNKSKQERKMQIVRGRLERNRFKSQALNNQLQVASLFHTDKDLVRMLKPYRNAKFTQIFKQGMKYYTKGDWAQARDEFFEVERSKGQPDYPTRSLIKVMEEFNFKAPPDWQGFRSLTEK